MSREIWVETLSYIPVVNLPNFLDRISTNYSNLIICSYAAALCLHLSTHHTSVIGNYYGNFSKLVIVRQLQSGKLYEFNFNLKIIALKDISNWYFFVYILNGLSKVH